MKLKVLFILILVTFFFFLILQSQAYGKSQNEKIAGSEVDSLILNLLNEINPDSIEYFMQSLEDFVTRYALAPNRFEIAEWIQGEFIRFGYSDVVLDSFEYYISPPLDVTTLQVNVIATLPGTERPDDIYISGGHYDAIILCIDCDPMLIAPGADDNASGTAAVLEIARVIKNKNFRPEATVKFICFGLEEFGGRGADHYAENAYNSGMNVKIMINQDMIGYTEDPLENRRVNICKYPGFEEYAEYTKILTRRYSILVPHDFGALGTDSYSFAAIGFPAISFFEYQFNPNYHDPTDLVIHCNMDYCAEVTRASLASLISFIGMPSKAENLNVVDIGNGKSLLLNWVQPLNQDFVGYKIYLGTEPGLYDTTYSSQDTSIVISDLNEGIKYYIGLTTYDDEGYESFMIEGIGTPLSHPLSPSNLTESPQWHTVVLEWSPNLEYDLFGYNIYRSVDVEEVGIKLNTEVITDTVYTDDSTENGIYYYYTVKAVDSTMNESINNVPVKSRAVSLDQGIVIVDESFDGNGSFLNPTDEEVDEFYNILLENFVNQDYDILAEGNISLRDLGAFSTVIWHGSDFRYVILDQKSIDDLQKYLDYGGNFIFTGFLPCEAFTGQVSYPADYVPGDFLYDYLKISHVENTFGSRFVGALPIALDYNSVFTDSAQDFSDL